MVINCLGSRILVLTFNFKHMKKIITILLLFAGILANAQTGNIRITIPGVKQANGKVQICLYKSADSFLKEDEIFKKATIVASIAKSSFTFQSIPVGDYAIFVYWDENENDKMDTNFIGIPKEEVGFSRNAIGSFGPPSFEDASFTVAEKNTSELVINIKKPSH